MRMLRDQVLLVKGVTVRFGGIEALRDCGLEARRAECIGLIGPNGSGKTTLLNVVCGIVYPDEGEVYLRGQRITGLRPHRIARLGIVRTFQIPRVFGSLTVYENLMGMPNRSTPLVDRALEFVGLETFSDWQASRLSYGQRKLLDFAKIFLAEPKIVLLDEPFAGVNPLLKAKMKELIKSLVAEKGLTFVVVEHEFDMLVDLCSRIYVLDSGRVIACDTPERIRVDPRVQDAYLGFPGSVRR